MNKLSKDFKFEFIFDFIRKGTEVEPCVRLNGEVVSTAGKRYFEDSTESYLYLDFAKNHIKNQNLTDKKDIFWPTTSNWK